MTEAVDTRCPRCGREVREAARFCALCGSSLSRAATSAPLRMSASVSSTTSTTTLATPARAHAPSTVTRATSNDDDRAARHEPWIFLAIGLATAPVFASTPILKFMGWFLASLVHEMGHAAFAWACGMPAVPAISLDGHAAAMHSEQVMPLVVMVGVALAWSAWKFLEGNARWVAIAIVAVLYPLIALTSAKELFHLLAGHAAELAFATLCLWKTLAGGFTESRLERALHGTVGWFLLGKNAFLCIGLMTSSAARAHYEQNGSFGLTNDYIRVAEEVLHWPIERVALTMLVACALVLPAALLLWHLTNRARANLSD